MRQRKVKNLNEKLNRLKEFSVENPIENKGKWSTVFGNDNPIYLEIGSGRGQFLSAYADKYHEANYIGIEGQPSVLLRALEKAAHLRSKNGKSNLKFICMFVEDIGEIFEKGELAGVYLNFSDPWPKARHNKRRLTYRGRLKGYAEIIKKEGFVQFKTDNDQLFEFTLEEIEACGFKIAGVTRDLHGSYGNKVLTENSDEVKITTEYEDKFKRAGKNINYVRIRA